MMTVTTTFKSGGHKSPASRRGIRCGFCCSDNRTIQQLVEESDQSLFKRVLNDNYHVLNCLLPDERHYCYNLRDRAHNRELHITSRLLHCNFLTRSYFSKTVAN